MATKHGSAVLRVIRDLAEKHGDEEASDRDLLRRFASRRDESAFTALVRRHGPMVMGVAQRVLRRHQDAEDVCQATFLLLARKAGGAAWRDSVAGWLYEAAYHLALKSRQAAQRRSAREARVRPRTPPDPLADITARDLQTVLDDELNRLARKYRTPLLLCCLEGKTRDEAARILGVPLSTVSGRLEAGRERLRRRLAGRGVPLSLALAGVTLLSATAGTAVPATLARATGQAALRVTAGEALTKVVSVNVASLVKGGVQAMFLTKLKWAAAGAMVLAAACFAAWAVLPRASAQDGPNRAPAALAAGEKPANQQKPQPAGPGTLLLVRQGGMVALTPEGKEGAELTAPQDTHLNSNGWLSPDGTRVAYVVTVNEPPRVEPPAAWPFKVVVRNLGAADPTVVVDLPAQQLTLTWAPDGKRVLVSKEAGARPNTTLETLLLDPETGKTEPMELPAEVEVLDWSRDGKTFLVVQRNEKKYRLGLAARGDKEVRVLTELKGWTGRHVGRLSPDGTKVLYTDADPADKDANKWGRSSKPYLLDVASKKRQPLAEFPENAQALGVAWAPDGKRVAYTWVQLHPEILKLDMLTGNDVQVETEAFLMVADADGRNAKTVSSGKCPNAANMIFGSIDWR
jgi:RNA polymerase sigma factor (sigma-70 family)